MKKNFFWGGLVPEGGGVCWGSGPGGCLPGAGVCWGGLVLGGVCLRGVVVSARGVWSRGVVVSAGGGCLPGGWVSVRGGGT